MRSLCEWLSSLRRAYEIVLFVFLSRQTFIQVLSHKNIFSIILQEITYLPILFLQQHKIGRSGKSFTLKKQNIYYFIKYSEKGSIIESFTDGSKECLNPVDFYFPWGLKYNYSNLSFVLRYWQRQHFILTCTNIDLMLLEYLDIVYA